MLLELIALLAQARETRTETWPGGGKKTEYEIGHDAQGNEVRQGQFRSFFEEGQVESEGAFEQDEETGPWVFRHRNGTRAAAGNYADGLKSGPWETFFESGKPESKGSYVRGAMDGRWTFWREDGSKDLTASGLYRLEVYRSKEDGRHYRGYRVDNVRQGTWTSYWPDKQKQFEGRFLDGKRAGEWVFTHPDGTPSSLLLSGRYSGGAWAGPLSSVPAPPFDAAKFPLPEASPHGWPAERDELALALHSALVSRTLSADLRAALARAGVPAIPLALLELKTLALDTEEGRKSLGFLEEEVLRPLCSGHGLSRYGVNGPPDAASAAELARAWLSLWALTRTDLAFWEADVPGPTRGSTGLRDLLQDPPLLERDARYDPSALRSAAPPAEATSAETPTPDAFRTRYGRAKEELLRRAPAGTQQAVDGALRWLAAHQSPDGRWSNDAFAANCGKLGKGTCQGPGSSAHDVGATGLALLAFLGDGQTPARGAQREVVARGLGWLAAQQDDAGLIGERAALDFIYDHAIATAALCESVGLGAEALRVPAEKAVALIQMARHPEGGWRYDIPAVERGDTSVTGWMVTALCAARHAGIAVDQAALDGALNRIDELTDPETGRVGYASRGELSARTPENERFPREMGEAMTAVGLLCRLELGQQPATRPILHEHAKLLALKPPALERGLGGDLYYWYYATNALFRMGDPYWDAWEQDLRSVIIRAQSKKADAEGSWDPIGPWGFAMGRVCSTALMALTVECYYRFPR